MITGDELRARGVTDLSGALQLMAGVMPARGGDAGPAGIVPACWARGKWTITYWWWTAYLWVPPWCRLSRLWISRTWSASR